MAQQRKGEKRLLKGFWESVEQDIFGEPLSISNQPKIVGSLKEVLRLEDLTHQGRVKQVDMFLKRRASDAVRFWKAYLGIGRGAPPKRVSESRCFRIGQMVEHLRRDGGHSLNSAAKQVQDALKKEGTNLASDTVLRYHKKFRKG